MRNILLAQMVCIFLLSCQLNGQTKQVLTADEFQQQLTSEKQLLDVRTAGEFNTGHIANAMQADWRNKDQFKDRVHYLDKNKTVLVYCQSGGRSAAAAKWLRENGFANVEELGGGMISWKKDGKPVEGATNVQEMSLDEYNAKLETSKTILVDFGAEWCPPCKKMQPVIDELIQELKGEFELVKVDGGVNTGLMKTLNIEGIPTFIIYKNGKEIWRQQGVVEKEVLKKEIKK